MEFKVMYAPPNKGFIQTTRIMKITVILLLSTCLAASASGYAQKVTLSENNATLEKVFREIKRQTGYNFLYNDTWLANARKVSVFVRNVPITEVLDLCFKDQPFSYIIIEKTISLKPLPPPVSKPGNNDGNFLPPHDISGMVSDEKSKSPLAGVSIIVKTTGKGTQTDALGRFILKNVTADDSITCSMIGYQTTTVPVKTTDVHLYVLLKITVSELDEVVVQGYGITSKRLATGNITRVSGDEIRKHPALNPLMALQGRVPGLIVTPTTGHASSPVKVELRGRNSLNKEFSGEPLYIIDGIPRTILDVNNSVRYEEGVSPGFIQSGVSNTGGQSPLFGLNPDDIESIEVLKDGDATAIYGSRAANGVIMITTKKTKPGKTSTSISFQQGITDVPRHVKMLDTKAYLQMRREAFKNDGIFPTVANAPDLMLWDTTRYTDWQNELLRAGSNTTINGAVSGGDNWNTFRLSGNYSFRKAMTARTGKDEVAGVNVSFFHRSRNQKLSINFHAGYIYTFVDAINFSQYNLPPNAPPIFDSKGGLNYAEWGGAISNPYPFAQLRRPTVVKTNSLQSSVDISYEIIEGLSVSSTLGYNNAQSSNDFFQPIASQNPLRFSRGLAIFGATKFSNWLIDPKINFSRYISNGKLEVMAGVSLQGSVTTALTTLGLGYTNDDLIGSIANAAMQQVTDGYGQYKYAALFGRINYNWKNKYIINLNARRDGSSRFAPGTQFGNFGSIGASWIPSEEKWMKKILPGWFNFIKLRSSYGLTGNDNIGDYQYLSQWAIALTGSGTPLNDYNGVRPYVPIHAVNQQYHWESNKKFEAALSLSFLKEKVNVEIAYYRNISDDQLTTLPTPLFTGFASIIANSDAKVENTGWEGSLSTRLIDKGSFSWSLDFNIGINRNKLLAYPGIEYSPHATRYKIGHSLSTNYLLHYVGIDPLTGNYSFEDFNKDGAITTDYSSPLGSLKDDRYVTIDIAPKYYGGIRSNLGYKNFSLGFAFVFRKQVLPNPFLADVPGTMSNIYLPEDALKNYWRKPGDIAKYPRFTTVGNLGYLNSSDGYYTDGSFLRLDNIAIAYSLPDRIIKKAGFTDCRLSVNLSNVFTITKYVGIDPNITRLTSLPSPRIITGNLSFTF